LAKFVEFPHGWVGIKHGKLEPDTFAKSEKNCRYACRAGFERIDGVYGDMSLEQLGWEIYPFQCKFLTSKKVVLKDNE